MEVFFFLSGYKVSQKYSDNNSIDATAGRENYEYTTNRFYVSSYEFHTKNNGIFALGSRVKPIVKR